MTILTQITVPFHNAELYVIEHEGQPYTPMKTIVEGMGLDWKSQFVKLKQRFAQGMVEITIPTNSGVQTMLCLLLRKLPAWLYSIHANKVKPELRDTVIMYQEECDDVLWDYWTKGQAINQRKVISPEQQDALQVIVDQRAGDNRKIRAEMWSRHNRHFNIAKYSQLLAVHFEESVRYLETMVLKSKSASTSTHQLEALPAFYDRNVQFLMWYMPQLAKLISHDIYPALKLLDSSIAGQLMSLSQESACHANMLNDLAIKNGMTQLEHVNNQPVHTAQWYLN